MAEKIETVMNRGTMFVDHRGSTVELDTPAWFNVPMETWFDEEALVTFLREKGILHATLHKGFEQHIIDLRAKARPTDLKPLEKGGKPRPQPIEEESAQKRVDVHKPEPRRADGKRPLTPDEKRAELQKLGFRNDQIDILMNME